MTSTARILRRELNIHRISIRVKLTHAEQIGGATEILRRDLAKVETEIADLSAEIEEMEAG